MSVLTELLDTSLSPSSTPEVRRDAVPELRFELKTKWAEAEPNAPREEDAIPPLALLAKTRRAYLRHIARQMNSHDRRRMTILTGPHRSSQKLSRQS